MKKQGKSSKWPAVILAAAILVIWQIAAMIANIPHIFPSPIQIVVRTWELREVLFLHHLPPTLVTIFAGWILAVVIGVALAVIMYSNVYIEAMLSPVLLITQTIPVMCISSGCAARRISSGGQPLPAMMPVRICEKSVLR